MDDVDFNLTHANRLRDIVACIGEARPTVRDWLIEMAIRQSYDALRANGLDGTLAVDLILFALRPAQSGGDA